MSLKAHSVSRSPEEEIVRGSDNAMMLLIDGALWDVLQHQAKHEGCQPGDILSKAVEMYLRQNGSEAVVAFVERKGGTRV